MKKAAFHNLGCKVNAYETESMQQRLEENGYEIVPFTEKADVYIINTCTVTNIADRKSRQMLHRAKKKNPQAIVVAVGCYVQASEEECKKDPAIDIIIGNNKKQDIVEILQEFEKEKTVIDTVIDINHTCEYEDIPVTRIKNHTRAYIKVQDGCNQFCTYCIIPYTRGRVRSRKAESVKEEVIALAKAGFQEIVLTGIHLSSYGIDRKGEETDSLLKLIVELHAVPGIKRIRLGSLEPNIITEGFVRTISCLPKVCPHFHLSLQSGSDSVLKRMNRHYQSKDYENVCKILRAYYQNPAITTDIIVGFPGETEDEFKETIDFAKKIAFFEIHVFKYSKRKGTRAAAMAGQLLEGIKAGSSQSLLAVEEKLSGEYRQGFIGKKVEILIEETTEIGGVLYQVGHTCEYIRVAIQTAEDLSGRIIVAELAGFLPEDQTVLYAVFTEASV